MRTWSEPHLPKAEPAQHYDDALYGYASIGSITCAKCGSKLVDKAYCHKCKTDYTTEEAARS